MSASELLVKRALNPWAMGAGAAAAGGTLLALPKLLEYLTAAREEKAVQPVESEPPDSREVSNQFGGMDRASSRWMTDAVLASGLRRRQMQNVLDLQNEEMLPGLKS